MDLVYPVYMLSEIKIFVCLFVCTRFIDDLVYLNDGVEFKDSYEEIYPDELELKCEHHERGKYATFLDLDIRISWEELIYKLFDKIYLLWDNSI